MFFWFWEITTLIFDVIHNVFFVFGDSGSKFCCYSQRFFVVGSPETNLDCYLQCVFLFFGGSGRNFCCYLQHFLVLEAAGTNLGCYLQCVFGFWKLWNQFGLLFTMFFVLLKALQVDAFIRSALKPISK